MTHAQHAQGAGPVTPENDEARVQPGFEDSGQKRTDSPDSAELDAARKARATLAAVLALKGYTLKRMGCGAFLIAKWDRSVECPDIEAVAAFVQRLGVRP